MGIDVRSCCMVSIAAVALCAPAVAQDTAESCRLFAQRVIEAYSLAQLDDLLADKRFADGCPGLNAVVRDRPDTVLSGFSAIGSVEPRRIVNPLWITLPAPDAMADAYPARAKRRNLGGRVTLDCIIGGDGMISCSVLSENPQGFSFGDAALHLSSYFRIAPTLADGSSSAGRFVTVMFTFALPE